MAVGALTLFFVLSYVLRLAFGDADWSKPALTLVDVAFWGLVAVMDLRRIGRWADQGAHPAEGRRR